mmetsp:Transcript_55613/g.153991  ORF Transcript_55613/g.153991 Transcript_55613/m.153991 type:complete len:80 (+) Transcript_55613:427-666(+)
MGSRLPCWATIAAEMRHCVCCGFRRVGSLRRLNQEKLEDPPASAPAEQAAALLPPHLAVAQTYRGVRAALHELRLHAVA